MSSQPNIVVIVQARLGSTRLPGKVLRDVTGRPMIELLLERLSRARLVSKIIVATSIKPENDRLEDKVCSLGHTCFRGSEDNVLERYYQAALAAKADIVIRITGDCPLTDPELLDAMIARFLELDVDYLSNVEPPTYPNGLDTEVFTFAALARAQDEAVKPYDREHVTPYIRTHESFRRANFANDQDFSSRRWTVDEASDLEVVRHVFGHFAPRTDFGWREVLALEKDHADWFALNASLKRNEGSTLTHAQKLERQRQALAIAGKRILFRLDAWPSIGTGHLMRCLTLADALALHGHQSMFVTRGLKDNLAAMLQQGGHKHANLPAAPDMALAEASPGQASIGIDWQRDAHETIEAARSFDPHLIVCDHHALDEKWEKSVAEGFSGNRPALVVLDDLANRKHYCRLLVDPTPGREERDYRNLVPEGASIFAGSRYLMLRPEFAQLREKSLARRAKPRLARVLVSLGGGDAHDNTGRILAHLVNIGFTRHCHVTAIIGPLSPHLASALHVAARAPGQITVLQNPSNMAELLTETDFAIGGAGSSALERAVLGVPSYLLTMADNQRRIAAWLSKAGAAIAVDTIEDMFVTSLQPDQPETLAELAKLGANAAKISDGLGCRLVIEPIMELL